MYKHTAFQWTNGNSLSLTHACIVTDVTPEVDEEIRYDLVEINQIK